MFHCSCAWFKKKKEDIKFEMWASRVSRDGNDSIYSLNEDYFEVDKEFDKESEEEMFAFVYPSSYMLQQIGGTPVFCKRDSETITIPMEEYLKMSDKATRYNWIKMLFNKGHEITSKEFDL